VVWRKAKGYIEDVFRTETRWAAREKRFTALTALEYRDRFLIELIQNGYDAHEPLSRDGLVWIRLDVHDGPFGCLYVANGGRPFSESNFLALSELGMCAKTLGAGIGPKGVGRRRWPALTDHPG